MSRGRRSHSMPFQAQIFPFSHDFNILLHMKTKANPSWGVRNQLFRYLFMHINHIAGQPLDDEYKAVQSVRPGVRKQWAIHYINK